MSNKYANVGLNDDAEYLDAVYTLADYEASDDTDESYNPDELEEAIRIVNENTPEKGLWG